MRKVIIDRGYVVDVIDKGTGCSLICPWKFDGRKEGFCNTRCIAFTETIDGPSENCVRFDCRANGNENPIYIGNLEVK